MNPPAPLPDPETAAYWEAAEEKKLLIRRCAACGRVHHYPRALCPFCFCDRTEWEEASGRGTIYSFSVMRRAAVPYAIAYVRLAEGTTMMTNIVDCDFERIAIGMEVGVVFKPGEDGAQFAMFAPV